ncbi:MAG: hypothetical protein CL663_09115 [Bacteroidetes bacterium]|nr:hypothetical protein [Bacteroidota bacterium]
MSLLTISFDFEFYPLLIVIAIAWLIPTVMSIFRLNKVPTVIVEIIVGYFIGKFFLQSFHSESAVILDYLALMGFIFLMFLSGLEIDVDQLLASIPKRRLTLTRFIKNPLLVGLTYFVVMLIASYIAALGLSYVIDIGNVWYFSLIMVTTSVGILLPVLKDRSETNSNYGQMLITAAVVADIFSIILFTITASVLKFGVKTELLWLLSIFVLFYLFMLSGKWLSKINIFRSISYQLSHAASQIKIRGTMLLILIFVVVSQYLGEEVVLLGAFLGGLLLSIFMHKDRSLLLIKLDGFGYGFLIPIFFIMVGVNFDAAALADLDQRSYLILGLLLLIMILVKVIPSFLWIKLFGPKKAMAGGVLMSSQLSLIIAAAAIGLELGIITPALNASFILLAVLTCIIAPVVFNFLNPKKKVLDEKTVIVGGTSTGVLLARRLHLHGRSSVIIEKHVERYNEIKAKGLEVVLGNGFDIDIYEKVGLAPENYVVVLTGYDDRNFEICNLIRHELQHEKLISRAGIASNYQNLKNIGVETFDATRILANAIENLIERPSTYHALIESFDQFHVEEIEITNPKVDGIQVKEIPFHGDGTMMMIRRADNMYVPNGETYLKQGDVVNVFGSNTALDDFKDKLSKV